MIIWHRITKKCLFGNSFTVGVIFFYLALLCCGCASKEVQEAYKHLKAARERIEPGVTYVKYDPEIVLKEYEIAYQISSKEFESRDYEKMAELYLSIKGNKEKSDEFLEKAKKKAKEEGPTKRGFWSLFIFW